jgi:hypothetical protein
MATTALSTTLPSINRRAILRGGSLAAVAVASPAASYASGPAAAPSSAGRRILALIAERLVLSSGGWRHG